MQPARPTDRFESLDVLRGFAVLGILVMNASGFAMISQAYSYPPAHMDLTGLNAEVWRFSHIFFELKFITIFSSLFGAGIVFMAGESDPARGRLHYNRMLWLLLFGAIHAYVFWWGDILFTYALLGMFAALFRRRGPGALLVLGLAMVALSGALSIGLMASLQLVPTEFDPVKFGFALSPEARAELVATYQAGFLDRLGANAATAALIQALGLPLFGPRTLGLMLIGMALFKSGFFTLRWSAARYAITAVIGLGAGLPLSALGAEAAIASDFALDRLWVLQGLNFIASLAAALGYASLVMLACRPRVLGLIRAPLAAAGRMALTNYLLQTLVMTFIFVGPPGLGLFGTVERSDQILIVFAVWAGQLIVSPAWLSVFRFGPFEWLWRSLTYGKRQPFLKGGAAPA